MTTPPRVAIVGGGISGLATAFFLRQSHPDAEVVVLEAADAPGGTARTRVVEGHTIELGPNGFLTNVPHTLDLARALGLGDELAPADESAKKRYLARDGRLVPLPMSPPAFLKTPLLSPAAKLRVALEPFIPAHRGDARETVFDFAARRLGREFAEAFVAPMVLGITAGDARQTSLDALFPRMRQMEQEYHSLFFAMLARARQGGGDPTGGRLTSFRNGGVGRLTSRLAEAISPGRVHLNAPVQRLQALSGGRWRVTVPGIGTLDADALVLATPAHVAAPLLRPLASPLADELDALHAAPIRVLALGWDASALREPLDGFGFLVARGQGVRMLGCLWTSSIFPWRAPAGRILLRTMWGGATDPGAIDLSLPDLVRTARAELGLLMGLSDEPSFVHDVAWPRGIPQYARNHPDALARIDREARRLPNLHLTGNAYRGVGLNDCVREAKLTAIAVGASLVK